MADNDLQDLTNARRVLTEMRLNWAKAIAAGYKRGEAETAIKIKGIIEVQQAIDAIDRAIEELEEAEEDDE
jgi:inorganic pyrophosphatase